ncbi:MAG: 4Fe-4S binding protein [Coriobacteriia bacterium]|nr:4Fe-4S binding protein [Coriobacteriia bacterium]
MERVGKVVHALTSRWVVKAAFLAVFVWSCVQLWRFAQWAKGAGPFVPRPEAVAGILPIGHFTSFFAWLKGGGWDTILPAGLVMIIGAIATSLLFKRGFCGWICPVGTIWELAAALGRKMMGGHNLRLPRWLDMGGRSLRYVIASLAFVFVARVSVQEALWFRELPYMWVADIKILQGFFTPVFMALIALAFVLSMLFGPVWCRWLCPLGGLYSLLGVVSPCTVVRDESTCIHCHRCTETCHAFVDVERAHDVRAPECDGCMDCVKECPVKGCLTARIARTFVIPVWVWPLLVVALWLGIYGIAKATGNWDTSLPAEAFQQVIRSGLLEEQTQGFF